MGMVFPLSTGGRIVLILIAVAVGVICWMMYRPQDWKWLHKKFKKKPDQ
jgi:hypothetical protein